jgi:class 3 adenylate cyclase
MRVCSNCGRENADDARFCSGCGTPLIDEATSTREERRIVTVLFVDLVGFTARAERLDPEDVRAILQPYYSRLRREIEAFGGTVEKFIGDAVMAVFGAPIAHGDDPERGVRAALAVREAVEEMNADDEQLALQVRIAVNTGEAIVALGAKPDQGEGMVAGDVVNTAARLQTAAPTGCVLVGESTYRATRSLFAYEPTAPLEVKGKSAPLDAWLVNCAVSTPGERSHSEPLVGRVQELGVLQRIFETVGTERRPHLVTVVGEAGIGKTRLATEFTEFVERDGARVLIGRSLPYGAAAPYAPFTQHVKSFAGIFASDDLPAADAKLRGALTDLLGADGANEAASHLELLIGLAAEGEVADRQILFLAARRFAEALARERPTVLVFEDIHWADEGTLDLLEVIAERVRDVPLLLLAHARPDLMTSRPRWGGGLPAYTRLSLETLAAGAARELALRLLAKANVAAVDVDGIAAKSEGNPLFIEELAASVAERSAGAVRELPTTIRELVSARLDGLPPDERAVVLDAAVVGKVFWRGVLEQMGSDGVRLSIALDALEARDLIRREPFSWIEGEEQFTFKHVMIRDVSYATLPRAERRERHAVVAHFLEEHTAGAAATATALAQHWLEAGEDDRALTYLVHAADQAARGWAKDEAEVLYGQALALVADDDAERLRDLRRKRAVAVAASLHVADARRIREREREPS